MYLKNLKFLKTIFDLKFYVIKLKKYLYNKLSIMFIIII